MARISCPIGHRKDEGVLRKNESVTVDPARVLWVEPHELVEQDVRDWGHTHGRTRVAGVGLEGRIDLYREPSQPIELFAMLCCDVWMVFGLLIDRSFGRSGGLASGETGARATYGEAPNGVDRELVNFTVSHVCGGV